MPFEGLSFVTTLVKFEVVLATDPFLHNVANIVGHGQLRALIFQNPGCFLHVSERKSLYHLC